MAAVAKTAHRATAYEIDKLAVALEKLNDLANGEPYVNVKGGRLEIADDLVFLAEWDSENGEYYVEL